MNENQNIFKHSEEQKLGCLYSREFQGALFPVRLPLALVDFFLGGGVVVGGATSSSGMAGGSPGVMGREGLEGWVQRSLAHRPWALRLGVAGN